MEERVGRDDWKGEDGMDEWRRGDRQRWLEKRSQGGGVLEYTGIGRNRALVLQKLAENRMKEKTEDSSAEGGEGRRGKGGENTSVS